MAKVKLEIDQETCIGCGTCAALAPDLFELSGDGKAVPKLPTTENADAAKEAKDSCPVGAISVK